MLSVDEVANLLGAAPGSSTGPHWAYAGPVRILVGERDMVERPDAVRAVFAEALPNAEVGIVDGFGHLLPIEAPGAISAACRSILADGGHR